MDGQAIPVSPPELVDEVTGALDRGLATHEGAAPPIAAPIEIVRDEAADAAPTRRTSPVAPERFAVLQAMLADLLESCGDEPRGELSASDLEQRYGLTDEALIEQVNLLNLVNFGGGCYAVYAEFDGDTIMVEKELYGEEFRRPARLSPLEAKAILMALDLVGPQVAAGAGTTLGEVRRKVEAAFGRFALRETPTPVAQREAEGILSAINDSIRNRRLVRIEYLGQSGSDMTERVVEPYLLRGVGSDWYLESYDRTGTASARSGSTGSAPPSRCPRRSSRAPASRCRPSSARPAAAPAPPRCGSRPRSQRARPRRCRPARPRR